MIIVLSIFIKNLIHIYVKVNIQILSVIGQKSVITMKFKSNPEPMKGFWNIEEHRIPVGYPRQGPL